LGIVTAGVNCNGKEACNYFMTLFIAVCDDDRRMTAELEGILIAILGNLKIKYEIDVYFTGEELCEKMENGAHYNLIFLDIVFAENAINGVEVGSIIRESYHNNLVSIVYISWETKYSMKLFDIRPFNFLIKPLCYDKIQQVLRTYLEIAGLWSGEFTYKTGHDISKVQIKDIIYIESVKRKLYLHLADGRKAEFYGILKDVYQEQLHRYDFLFIHASYVVNYDYIVTAKYNEMILVNTAASLPVSQNRRKEVREAYYAIMEKRRI